MLPHYVEKIEWSSLPKELFCSYNALLDKFIDYLFALRAVSMIYRLALRSCRAGIADKIL